MSIYDNVSLEQTQPCLQETIDGSSDSETENSNATPRSFTSGTSSQLSTPRSNLLWDHGYDVAENSADSKNKRELEWQLCNITDDDKLNADKHVVNIEKEDTSNVKEHQLRTTYKSISGQNYLPDLLAFTASADMAESPNDNQCIRNVGLPMNEEEERTSLSEERDTPPPLPATSPPSLSSPNAQAETTTVHTLENQTLFENKSQLFQPPQSNETPILADDQITIANNIEGLFNNLMSFDSQSVDSKQYCDPYVDSEDSRSNDTVVRKYEIDAIDSEEEEEEEEEEEKNDIEEEFEAILHAFDLNFGQDTYVERFAGRRDRYGFILSPVTEAPSPTPSSLSGYSGRSSASPDPFSVFRMSPAPRGSKLDLDLSSLGVNPGEVKVADRTVPIYQTVQARKVMIIPEGYGWDSGDDLLSPTGSGDWDFYENGLSTPPVSASSVNFSQFGTHVVGWKQPQDVIFEEPEGKCDSDDTMDADSNSGHDSDSTIEDIQQNKYTSGLKRELNDNTTHTDECLYGESRELELFANEKSTPLEINQYEELRANQQTPIAEYLDKQSELQRPESIQSLMVSASSSENSDAEDAEDECSDSEDEKEVEQITYIDDEQHNVYSRKAGDDQSVLVSEILSPRTAILLSGGMFPEESDSSYMIDDEEEQGDEEENPERDSNMSSYGSGVLVTQYTSGDSDEDKTKYATSFSEANQDDNSTNEHEKLLPESDDGSRHIAPIQILSPLDFSFLPKHNVITSSMDSPQSAKEDGKRSPRVFGRYYSEMEDTIIEKASKRTSKSFLQNEDHEERDYHSKSLSPDEIALADIEKSFTQIEFEEMPGLDIPKLKKTSVSENESPSDSTDSLVRVKSNAKLEKSVLDTGTGTYSTKTFEKCTPQTEIINENTAKLNIELNNSAHMHTHSKSKLTPPMKIEVSHLTRKGSFTNKVKRGYVHQLSEIFMQKDADTRVKPTPAKISFKKNIDDAKFVSKSPQMLVANENIIISEQQSYSPVERIDVDETILPSANESLGFEVTILKKVDSFNENVSGDDINLDYDDDFESDSENDSTQGDNYLQEYEKQLAFAEGLQLERHTSENDDSTESSNLHTGNNTENEDAISEQIDGDENSDRSEDEELFRKIHASDILFNVGQKSSENNAKKPEIASRRDAHNKEGNCGNQYTPSAEDIRELTHINVNPVYLQTPTDTIGSVGRYVNSNMADPHTTETESNSNTQCIPSMHTQETDGQHLKRSSADLGGIFWNPNLLQYKALNSKIKEESKHEHLPGPRLSGSENISLLEMFSKKDTEKKPKPQELHRSAVGNGSKDTNGILKDQKSDIQNNSEPLSLSGNHEHDCAVNSSGDTLSNITYSDTVSGTIYGVPKDLFSEDLTQCDASFDRKKIINPDLTAELDVESVEKRPHICSERPQTTPLFSETSTGSCNDTTYPAHEIESLKPMDICDNRHSNETEKNSFDGKPKIRYPASLSRRLYGPYCRINKIGEYAEQSETTPAVLPKESEATEMRAGPLLFTTPSVDESRLTLQASPSSKTESFNESNGKSHQNPHEFKFFEYREDDIRNSCFESNKSKLSPPIDNSLNDLACDLIDNSVEKRDGGILYPDGFEHFVYNVKSPHSSPAQRNSLKPQSRPITYCNTAEAQQEGRSEKLFSKSNQRCVDKSLPVISHTGVVSSDYANEENSVHADLNEGGSSPETAVKNDFSHDSQGVYERREITANGDTHQNGTMRNDMQPLETKQNVASAVSPRINVFSSGQTDRVCQQRRSEGEIFTYHGKDSDKKSLWADGGETVSIVLVQTADYQHVLEDEKGNLKPWPYSDFESCHKVPVTLHSARRQAKLIVRKSGMSVAPSNMTVIQTAQHSAEMPEDRMMERYHSSSVMPEERNIAKLMQTHGASVQNVLFNDANGNTLTEEELSAILPNIAESVSKMKDVNAEEILPGITQSITKLQNGGNLVITTMTRKLDEVESDESGRGSPEPEPPHPILNVDDLENSKIYLVRDSKGELFYVEDITSESQESAYFSSGNPSDSISDGGYSPNYQKISEIRKHGKSDIQDSTAEELISAMYDQNGIQEYSENEEEWSERTYEFGGPRARNAKPPRQEYSKDSFHSSYMVEEPETLPRANATTVSKDRFESSYEVSGGMPWVYDGGLSQSYSQAAQGVEEVDSASAVSGAAGTEMTRTHEVLTVEAETEIYPLVPYSAPPLQLPMFVPPVAVQTDTPQYSLVKVDVTPKKVEPVQTSVSEPSKTVEVDDRPIYKTVAHIQTRDKQPSVKSEMAEPKRYRILSTEATRSNEEEQETKMSLDEVDYNFSAENVEYKVSPRVQQTQFYVRNTTNLETPARYRSERKLEINNNSLDQKYKTEIQVENKQDDLLAEESSFYSYDEMRAKMEHTDTSMKVVRGSYMIKNNLEEVDSSFDDNLNMFDGDFTLRKDNPLYQSDEDLYRKYEREKAELARKQEHFQRKVNNDIAFETVDKFSRTKTVHREERPKQSLSELLLRRLSTVDTEHIRQKIDVKHHSEDIYGDPRFLHADGSTGAQSSNGTNDFDSVGEKVDLLIKNGKAFITVKVTAERIVPLDMEFNVWRKNQAIVTRTIEVDLLATEHRRRLYFRVMEETPGGTRASHMAGPTETILDSKQTLELFTKILGAADGEGDKEDITVRTRSGRTTRPFTSGMDLLY